MLSTLLVAGLFTAQLATATSSSRHKAPARRTPIAQRWESKHTCVYSACGADPTCDGCSFAYSGTSNYTLSCGNRVQGSDQWVVESDGLPVTGASDCLEACDEWPQCGGVFIAGNGSCIAVSNRTAVNVMGDAGSKAYVRTPLAPVASPSVSGAAPSSYFNASSSISPLPPTTTTPASTQSPGQCQMSSIACPDCDGEQVTDANGKPYKVYCDSQIFSEDQYSIQEWLSPQGCLAECDRFSWCEGTTYYANRNCELANGTDAFPEQMPGYTGFLPVATTSYVSATAPSAFPTTNSYIPVSKSTAVPAATVPLTMVPAASPPTVSCESSEARCPLCDGISVVDWLNVTYTISCQEVPICETIIHREDGTSQFECLEYCDADPVCFAAVWNRGDCLLCQDGLDGTIFNDQPDDPKFLVYYPESAGTASASSIANTASTTSAQVSTTSPSYGGYHSRSRSRTWSHGPYTTSSAGSSSISPFHGGTFITALPPNATLTSTATASEDPTTTSLATSSSTVVTSAYFSILPINGDTLITAPTPSSTSLVVVITGTISGADYVGR